MNLPELKYPIGQQDFASIISDGYIYVDKTALIYRLVRSGKYFFLARPRRFGKSLLLSTIRYYFEGRKELFKGLKIRYLEILWDSHPVLHLQLSRVDPNSPLSLESTLNQQFSRWEKRYGIANSEEDLTTRFVNIIQGAFEKTGRRVVVLIDEYDNPLINTIGNRELYEKNRSLLKSIYVCLKDLDEYIRFGMLTGVSRFSSLSIFSGLNNLRDITFDARFSALCGFTEEEIQSTLGEGLKKLSESMQIHPEDAIKLLKENYDGYHFSEDLTDIYNPFSLLNCLDSCKIENYWFRSGTPTFLIKALSENRESFSRIFNADATSIELATNDVAFDDPVSLLFQTGYLTIKRYDPSTNMYRLGVPNLEVDRSLFLYLLAGYSHVRDTENLRLVHLMADALEKGEPEEFIEVLKSVLAPISYRLNGKMTELDFERTMFVILHLLGLEVTTELETSQGRIDLVVKTKDFVYIIELKLDKTAEEALQQINSRDYTLQWEKGNRKVFKVGISFSSVTRNISSYLIQ
ncbi:MAG: AAA family ATPase [Muribaculaceae bacterium]|nr:AAA family ATPase [Muribaculaceae bacterium]